MANVVESSDESSATLSDAEDSELMQPGRQRRRGHRDLELWTPGGDRDPWPLRTGTKDKSTQVTQASIQLYDKVDGGRPPRAILNNPTSVTALRYCHMGILYDNDGKKIKDRLPRYLAYNRRQTGQFVMPESIPTTREDTTEPAEEEEMEDDEWKGYTHYDGSEMDVIQALNDFSLAAKRYRKYGPPPPRQPVGIDAPYVTASPPSSPSQNIRSEPPQLPTSPSQAHRSESPPIPTSPPRSESPPPPPPASPPPPADTPVARQHRHHNHHHHRRCQHGKLPQRHIADQQSMHTSLNPSDQPHQAQFADQPGQFGQIQPPVQSVPTRVPTRVPAQVPTQVPALSGPILGKGFLPPIQVTPATPAPQAAAAQQTLRPNEPRSEATPNLYLFPTLEDLKPIPLPGYTNQVVSPSQSIYTSPYVQPYRSPYATTAPVQVQARESNVRDSYVRDIRPLPAHVPRYMGIANASTMANSESRRGRKVRGGKGADEFDTEGTLSGDDTEDLDVKKES